MRGLGTMRFGMPAPPIDRTERHRSSIRHIVVFSAVVATLLSSQSAAFATSSEIEQLREEVKALREEVALLRSSVRQGERDSPKASGEEPKRAGIAGSGNEHVALTISGHANRLILYADDGGESQFFNADNEFSSSRVNLTGRASVTDDLSLAGVIEVEIESNSTDRVQIGQDRADNANAFFRERTIEVVADSQSLGRLSIGQGSTAADGTFETILSGTDVIAGSKVEAYGGRLEFRREIDGQLSGRQVINLISNQDSGRDDRVRYDTPSLKGLTASASWADGDRWETALRYSLKSEGGELQAALGYLDGRSTGSPGSTIGATTVGGSVSYEAPFGANLQAAYSRQDFELAGRSSAEFWWVMLGQDLDFTELGPTAISVSYAHAQDQALNGSVARFWGIAAVQDIRRAATQLYFAFGQFTGELPGAETIELDSITVATLGARVKF